LILGSSLLLTLLGTGFILLLRRFRLLLSLLDGGDLLLRWLSRGSLLSLLLSRGWLLGWQFLLNRFLRLTLGEWGLGTTLLG
jgi:hypothetical protein